VSLGPIDTANLPFEEDEDEAPPRVAFTRRSALLAGFFVLSVVGFLYFVLPQLTGLKESWRRLEHGDPWWLVAAAVFEAGSYFGHIWLFRVAFVRNGARVTWGESYEVTLAGVAATRLFSAAGAGGLALTAWAMRRWGLERRVVACRLVAFLVLLYCVYDLALVIGGFGLYFGIFPGPAPFAITVVPAIFGVIAFAATLAIALVPRDIELRLRRWSEGHGLVSRLLARIATVPASFGAGVRTAIEIARRRELGLLGSIMWWGFDIATLWACFHAFSGEVPPTAVIVVAYFVGMLANTLPLPGGVGGVDGGMIGAFVAFGVDFGYATVAVLAYRAFSFWLPTIPGALAYLQLRRTVSRWSEERQARRAAERAATAPA
jgi:putative heme transporter